VNRVRPRTVRCEPRFPIRGAPLEGGGVPDYRAAFELEDKPLERVDASDLLDPRRR